MSEEKVHARLPVVAIGASAGGLEACRALLAAMPGDTPAALILVLHLDPKHDSMMVDLLAAHTALSVVQATQDMKLRAGVVHVIPPGVFLTVTDRVIQLSEPDIGKGVRLPFDALLRSLAKDASVRPACIVLSGTGTDGTMGLADIRARNGLIIAQDPAEASYPGMPDSAVATGLVDHVLNTAAMVDAIGQFSASDTTAQCNSSASPKAEIPGPGDYDALLAYVGSHATQDISLYKRGTLERRVARRMAIMGLGPDKITRYLERLQSDPEELTHLTDDLLIHVTSFFRDPPVFDHLVTKAIPALLADTASDRPLRVWVAGCSTGEEAYSLAIVCLEAMEATGISARVQILASDVDPDAIATARAGVFPQDIADTLSPERLSRYFVAEGRGYRVTTALRDMIVFTVADLLSDPPFSRIDLVSCRNVLIYLGPEAQRRVIARCCFALRPGGLLLLGTAEMPGPADKCFAIEHKESRLWRRVGKSHAGDMQFATTKREEIATAPGETPARRGALAELCRRVLLENYAPAAALMNSRLDCLYLLGPADKYLKVTQGHVGPGILGMMPKAVRARFKAAAAECGPAKPKVTTPGVRTEGGAGFDLVLHSVSTGPEPLILVCFIDTPQRPRSTAGPDTAADPASQVADLEADLAAARSDLSDALRDLEQEIEAHGVDAAEALSVNEEFQSTNEELLASKEELQSLNEELTALNSQLQETLERHRTTANDLQNVLYSTDVATLFLDLDLNIRFFTPAARSIFRVIATDVGRPLADLAAVVRDDALSPDALAVLASSQALERETAGLDGRWFLRRIQPYRGEGDRVEGVVITYIDITEPQRINAALEVAKSDAERATRAKTRFLASASHDLRQPLQSMALLHKLLSRPKRSTEGQRLAALLDQTLISMTAMLDSMLDVTRIETGIVQPEMRPVPMVPLFQRLVDEFAPQCALKGITLRSVPCKAWVQTDPQLLEQILRNLLSNALKYTIKGGIVMGCRRRGAVLTIVVCDSGIGVNEAESAAIFAPYHQGDKAVALGFQGIGLGLAIVQRLAHLMGHKVTLSSIPGKGSAFMITLDVVVPSSEAETPETAVLPAMETTPLTGTILVVEDEDPLRDLLAEVLANEGHTVFSKSSAQEALDWASGDVGRPDLLLTDFDLQGHVSGLTLALDLPDVLGGTLPTIILTGDITSDTHAKISASSCHQVLKPVMPEVLLAQVSDLLRKARDEKSRLAKYRGTASVTIHVIDDDAGIREAMRRLFEAEGWGVVTYQSAEEFLAEPRPDGVACLLVDNLLPGMTGVELIRQLRAERSRLPVVMLTGHGDVATSVSVLKAGAADMIEKPASAADLLASVRQAIRIGDDIRPLADSTIEAKKRFSRLTEREREVMMRVLAGEPNKIIAADLGLNQRTVESHRASVMRKTGTKSLPALMRLALAADLQGV